MGRTGVGVYECVCIYIYIYTLTKRLAYYITIPTTTTTMSALQLVDETISWRRTGAWIICDAKYKEKVEARNDLKRLCLNIEGFLSDNKEKDLRDKADQTEVSNMKQFVDETLGWIETNNNNDTLAEKEEMEEKRKKLEDMWQSIYDKLEDMWQSIYDKYDEGSKPKNNKNTTQGDCFERRYNY